MGNTLDLNKSHFTATAQIQTDNVHNIDINNSLLCSLFNPGPSVFIALFAALGLSACAGGQQISPADAPVPIPRAAAAETVVEVERSATTESPVAEADVASQAAPVPEKRPEENARAEPIGDSGTQTPVPQDAPRQTGEPVVEVVRVTETPTSTMETTEVVETADQLVERKETVETTERIIGRIEVDEKDGRIEETVDVIESTQKTVDVVTIDKQTSASVEVMIEAAPVEKRTERVTIVMEDDETGKAAGPMDRSRRFAGPDGIETAKLAGFGIVAIRPGMHADERDRLLAICEAFTSPTPDIAARDEPGMLTIWPVSSTARAEQLNTSAGAPNCLEAVERYGLADAKRAIADAERTGWILDNRGPYLLAWSPPEAKGGSSSQVLLADFSGIATAEGARAVMHRWANDVENNSALWAGGEWDTTLLRPIIDSWREEFGTRALMLLGPVGG